MKAGSSKTESQFWNEDVIHRIYEHIDRRFDFYLSEIQRYLRQPGISTTGEGITESAEMVLKFFRSAGVDEVHLAETTGNPVVFAKWNSKNPDAKTLLAYTLYDLVPVNPTEWISHPFAAQIHEASQIADIIGCPSDLGKVIVGRGAFNQRAPFLALLFTLQSINEVMGTLPVNVIFTLDGEEEIASPSWPQFLKKYESELKRADAAYHHGFRQDESGKHRISCGYKGYTLFELIVRGGKWGGTMSAKDLWAPDIIWVDSPLLKLLFALCTLIDPNGRCTIEGIYDSVESPGPEEKILYEKIKVEFNEEAVKKARNISRFLNGQKGRDLIVDWISQPILNIDGISSGQTGAGFSTAMPQSAVARCDIRIVPNMTVDEFYVKLRRHLDKAGFPMIEIKRIGGIDPGKTPPGHPFIQAAVRASEKHQVKTQVWPISPAGDPMAMYARPPFNLPIMLAGIGHSDKFHVANEWCAVEGIRANMKWTVSFLQEWISAQGGS